MNTYLEPEPGSIRAHYALLTSSDFEALPTGRALCERLVERLAGQELRGTGRLRLPDTRLLQSLLQWHDDPGRQERTASALREHAYDSLCKRSGFFGFLQWLAGGQKPDLAAGRGVRDYFFMLLPAPLFYFLPRWLWTLRCDHRLMRRKKYPWWACAREVADPPHPGHFFNSACDWLTNLGAGEREKRERAVWAALLSDLALANRPGRLRPHRRRRRTRCVVLVGPPGDAHRAVHEQHLTAYGEAARRIPYASVVLVAGQVGDGRLELNDAIGEWTPRTSANQPQLNARLDGPLVGAGQRAPLPLPEPFFRPVTAARAELGLEVTVAAAALGLLIPFLPPASPSPASSPCLEGNPPATAAPPPTVPQSPASEAAYDQVRDMIRAENEAVDQAVAERGVRRDRVRTVVYVGAGRGNSRFGSGLPELRGVALGQREANRMAEADTRHGVWLKIRALDAGVRFKNAPRVARDVVGQAAQDPSIIGVLGFSESREETQAAVRELTRNKIPVVITTATADAMRPAENGDFVHRISPLNSRETEVEAAFAQHAAVIDDASGGCGTARAAVVVRDPNDLYSNELGNQFREKFEGLLGTRPYSVAYYPSGSDGSANESDDRATDNIVDVAEAVCDQLRKEPRTLLYWAARAENFSAFLTTFNQGTACGKRHLSVLGGNELTNAALAGEFPGDGWLRLYHTVHALPTDDDRRTTVATTFSREYADTWKNDLWRNDGHAAQGRDAVVLFYQAAATISDQQVTSELIQNTLHNANVQWTGASGALRYTRGEQSPQNKPVVILRHFDDRAPVPVLVCGAFTLAEEEDYGRWGPDDKHPCPTDD